ncbi:MAG: hypothetical protein A2W22_00140 [Candidatus Levybacteria bacterium RBG_16_35_11]|nr:MAG: hypothetical protein A2W22_00140 [Candidatus Levybacteria bacterium RBG_16_35_11]
MCERNKIFENNHGIAVAGRMPHLESLSSAEAQTEEGVTSFKNFTPVIDLNSYRDALKALGVDEKSRDEKIEVCKQLLETSDLNTKKTVALGVLNIIRLSREIGLNNQPNQVRLT